MSESFRIFHNQKKYIRMMKMNQRGWMAWLVAFLFLSLVCFVVASVMWGLNIILSMGLFHSAEAEQKFITPFLIIYSSSSISIDEKPFFQEMSYVASGQLIGPSFSSDVIKSSRIMANAYKISLYTRSLMSFGVLGDGTISGAVIPLFTFEKKDEKLLVTAS